MKLLQLLSEPAVRCPGLAPTEWSCENNGTVDLELSGESDDVLLERLRAKPSKCLACFADPRCDLSVKRSIAGVSYLLFLLLLFLFFFTTVLSQWDLSHGKFGLPSPEKASCDRVVLPNLRCMLSVLAFP